MSRDRDYVLGTHDEEVVRLGVQHRVWRSRALEAWRRAGFGAGQTILDLGCGPGYASLDLAEVVGPAGRVVGVDRSRRFLDVLESEAGRRGLDNITVHEIDLDQQELPVSGVDGAWSRWVFAFVKRPRDLLARVGAGLRRGGALVTHEYFHYATWRVTPRCPELEEFVQRVVRGWRASGGEPDVGLDLPRWLVELGYEVRSLRPIVDVVPPDHPIWQWPKTFLEVGLERLVELGELDAQRAREMSRVFGALGSQPGALMVTPAVLEIVAVRR